MNGEQILDALVEYCREHPNYEFADSLTCDEHGCGICNADSPEQAAGTWFALWEGGQALLPFDPYEDQ